MKSSIDDHSSATLGFSILICGLCRLYSVISGRPRNRGSTPGRDKKFLFPLKCANLQWGPPSPLLNRYRGDISRGETVRAWIRPFTSDAEVKNEWTYTYTPPYAFTKCAGTTLVYDILWHSVLIYIQQDATLHSLFYLENALHVLGGNITHHHERKQLYLQHLAFVTPLLLSAAIVEELELVWVCCGWRTPRPLAHNYGRFEAICHKTRSRSIQETFSEGKMVIVLEIFK